MNEINYSDWDVDKASRERVVTYTFILEESLLGACGLVNRDRREEEIGRLLGA